MMLTYSIIAFLAAYVGMEAVAWLAHRYLMHGWFWFLHRDHHQKDPSHFLERNDWFFVVFATPAIVLLFWGMQALVWPAFGAGLGITAYGFSYFLIHDVFIHQRLPWLRRAHGVYFSAIRKAHRRHHMFRERTEGESFGMLWVPIKYFTEARQQQKQHKTDSKNG